MSFQYSPLSGDEIRLCRVLEQRSQNGLIQLELKHFGTTSCLNENTERERVRTCQKRSEERGFIVHVCESLDDDGYTAVSYTWGSEYPQSPVEINGCTFALRQNIFNFIDTAHECQEFKTWFWIDQICIDQANVQERSCVVMKMHAIFGSASWVRIWLGRGDKRMTAAIGVLRDFVTMFSRKGVKWRTRGLYWYKLNHIGAQYFAQHPEKVRDLDHLCQHRYWTRQWIVQEIWVAQRICFQHGTARCSWLRLDDGVRTAIDRMSNYLDKPYDTIGFPWAAFRKDRALPHMHLWSAIGKLSGKCTDPRDLVFAIMGVVIPSERFPVDYTLSVTDVFWKTVDGVYAKPRLFSGEEGLSMLHYLMRAMGLENKIAKYELYSYVDRIFQT